MMQTIEEVNGHYVISENNVWLPGAYESEQAAKYAFHFKHQNLHDLQESVNPGGVITLEMLQGLRKKVPGGADKSS